MLNGEYYSKGKLLLTGEYLVLQGALALSVPLKLGQQMKVGFLPESGIIKWETYEKDQLWFSGTFHQKNFEPITHTDRKTALFIQKMLKAGDELQPGFIKSGNGIWIENRIDFDLSWGLGSSSSLVSNFAWWLGISPWTLYRKLFQGSGYDVFCSRAMKPILYQLNKDLPVFREVDFRPSYLDRLYFVYLGKKQDSQQSVTEFLSKSKKDPTLIRKISALSMDMVHAGTLDDFMNIIAEHEKLISGVLGMNRVKEEKFPDFPGEVKSLGAWGGDFVLAASKADHIEVMNYFSNHKLDVVFRWEEIVY